MAEQIVFGDDLDNVTVKNINGKLTAVVNVENAEDEFEVVTDYVEPQEDDDYYVESVFAKFRHKAMQFLTDAYKKEKKPRSASVNESLDRQLTAGVQVDNSTFTFYIETTGATSLVDGADFTETNLDAYSHQVHVQKSDYANAKAFNEAHAGKTFTITTAKRYAKSEGHPVVKPTEIQVAYPTLPYLEKTVSSESSHDAYLVEIGGVNSFGSSQDEKRVLAKLDQVGHNVQHNVSYTIRLANGQEYTGTHTFTGYGFDRRELPNYPNDASTVYEKYEFEPYVLENFDGKVTVNPQPYKKEVDTL